MNPEQQPTVPQITNEPVTQPPVAQQPQQPVYAGAPQGFPPAPTMPPKKSKLPLIIAMIVLLAVLGAGAFMLFAKKDEVAKTESESASDKNSATDTNSGTSQTTANSKSQDVSRRTNINGIYSKLEEYYNDNEYYPPTFTAATFAGIDSKLLIDPNGNTISIAQPVKDRAAATALSGPTESGAQMQYIPYSCTGNECLGYVMRAFMSVEAENPFVKNSLN